jgi:hypothetical protein
LDRFFAGYAAGIGDRTRRFGLFGRDAAIGSFEHDFARIVFQAGPLEQSSQRHPRPFGITDRAQLPLRSTYLRDEKHATITGALQRGDPRFGRHLA